MSEKKVLKDDVSGLIVTKVHECHLERQNNDIVVVTDDKIVDYDNFEFQHHNQQFYHQ